MKMRFAALLLMFLLTPAAHAEPLRMLVWNVESGGSDPEVIASALTEFDGYHLFGLSEVSRGDFTKYRDAVAADEESSYRYIGTITGGEDRLLFVYDTRRLSLNGFSELFNHRGTPLNDGRWRHRSPLVAHFYDKTQKTEFLVVLNHLARGDADLRTLQAKGLRQWAASQSLPVVVIGDLNFDYQIDNGRGNEAFDEFFRDEVFTWVKPEPLENTNYYDGDGDGLDDYPNSILDFAAVAGAAKKWPARSKVIVRAGDFPDDDSTSDHRPVEVELEIPGAR